MRKVLCVIVIIAMIITIIPACSFAAEKELLNCSITNNKPRAGDEIAVKVKFSNLKDAMSIEGYININERVFEPISTESIASLDGKHITIDNRPVEIVDVKDIEEFYTKSEEAFYLNTEPFTENDNKFILDLSKKVSGDLEFSLKLKVKDTAKAGTVKNAVTFDNIIVGKSDGTQNEFGSFGFDINVTAEDSINNITLMLSEDEKEAYPGQVFPLALKLIVNQTIFQYNYMTADVSYNQKKLTLQNYTPVNGWSGTVENKKMVLERESTPTGTGNVIRFAFSVDGTLVKPGDVETITFRNIYVGMKDGELVKYPGTLKCNITFKENTSGQVSNPVIEINEIENNKVRVVSSDEVGLYSVEYVWNNDESTRRYAAANGNQAVQFDVDKPAEDAVLTVTATNVENRSMSISQKIEKATFVAQNVDNTAVPAEDKNMEATPETKTNGVVASSVDKDKKDQDVGVKTEAAVAAVDDTTAKNAIPKTGFKTVVPIILLVFSILSLVIYKKYNNLSSLF